MIFFLTSEFFAPKKELPKFLAEAWLLMLLGVRTCVLGRMHNWGISTGSSDIV